MTRKEVQALRRQAILNVVATQELRTQEDIVRVLRKRGIRATQVSVSRDVEELGLVKAGGRYRPSQGEVGQRDPQLPLRAWVREAKAAGPYLVVARCEPGMAQGVARALDQASLAGVVGTVAGDDTVFVAADSERASQEVLTFISERIKG